MDGNYGEDGDDYLLVVMRGHEFQLSKNVLRMQPESRLSRFVARTDSDVFRCNRNPQAFHSVLDFYNTGELHLPEELCGRSMKLELEYWEIGLHLVMPCCINRLSLPDKRIESVRHVQTCWQGEFIDLSLTPWDHVETRKPWQVKLENFLDRPHSSRPATVSIQSRWFFFK